MKYIAIKLSWRPRSGVNKLLTTKSDLEGVSSKSCSDVIPAFSIRVFLSRGNSISYNWHLYVLYICSFCCWNIVICMLQPLHILQYICLVSRKILQSHQKVFSMLQSHFNKRGLKNLSCLKQLEVKYWLHQ